MCRVRVSFSVVQFFRASLLVTAVIEIEVCVDARWMSHPFVQIEIRISVRDGAQIICALPLVAEPFVLRQTQHLKRAIRVGRVIELQQ